MKSGRWGIVVLVLILLSGARAWAQESEPNRMRYRGIPQWSDDQSLTFRLTAPDAQSVKLVGGDLPGVGRGVDLAKGDDGVWTAKIENVPAGAFRYQYVVDGATMIDPANPLTSESNSTLWSLTIAPGDERFDPRNIHQPGSLSEISYLNTSIGMVRRAHVYLPHGYEKGTDEYPVLYLLHGASDSDDSWSTVGLAGTILDNLIGDGAAVPMIVVMPDGHTGPFSFGPRSNPGFEEQMAEFREEFTTVLRPLIESRYRVKEGRENRAIAGLSMGGFQTLDIAFAQPNDFGYIMVMSSGLFGIAPGPNGQEPNRSWLEAHADALAAESTKEGLRLFWFGCGKEDFLLETSNATVSAFRESGFEVTYDETEGGHTWLVWRDYLANLGPKLFQP